ncbi:DUF6338 family protein [Candidatus Leptofilum sp.]|uniref:DUF6338 family protein n=1 Tax=Candidatus Leptofilum sp. TaxID=3241576 RepID=UPI003B5B4C84
MFTFQALQILLFLVPGFFAAKLFDSFVTRETKQSDLARIEEAVIFSLLIYAIYALIQPQSAISFDQSSGTINYTFDAEALIFLSAISMILPIILSYSFAKNFHMKLLNRLGVSQKSSRFSVWDDAFQDYQRYIVIDFENGRRLYGWPRYYSDGNQEICLLIHKPLWIIEGDEGLEMQDTGFDEMLITQNQKIDSIGFMPIDFEEI